MSNEPPIKIENLDFNLERVLKIFSFEKKGDLEKYCRSVVISSRDFFALVVACELTRNPFSHEISYRDKVSEHLNPSDSEIQALKSTPAGSLLTGDAEKAVRKMSQMFVSATRTPSCKDSRRNAMLRHDQALKEGLDEVAKAGFRAVT
jgi:hypothetical protein